MAVDIDDVRDYLGSQPGSGPLVNEVLAKALDAAEARVQARIMEQYRDPHTRPVEVDQAVTMQAARLYRRRFSVSGFEGFGELGIARVSALDSDIEDLLIRVLRYDFA